MKKGMKKGGKKGGLPYPSLEGKTFEERRKALFGYYSQRGAVRGGLDAPLAYKHMSKTGGTFLERTIAQTFGRDALILNDFVMKRDANTIWWNAESRA